MFGHKPKQYASPLESGDHPELDTSQELEENDINKYQSMIGSLQWAILIGLFNISTAVMSLSSFRAFPRQGYLKRLQSIYGHLVKHKDSPIRICISQQNYKNPKLTEYDWKHSVYGNMNKIIPNNSPHPLGKPVVLTTYVDANLYHSMTTGQSVSGILHLINQTPFKWYSKKLLTFTAARIAEDQIISHRILLRYLGVPIRQTKYVFGDNQSVVNSFTITHWKLHERHTALSYNRVREAIAAKINAFIYIPVKINPADILSKHWGYQQVKNILQVLQFHKDDTNDLI